MGLWERFFGPAIDPDSVPPGPVVAFPFSLTAFAGGGPVVVRFAYSPDPDHAEDLAAVHRTLHNCHADEPAIKQIRANQATRSGGFHWRVPGRLSGSVPVWLRDVAIPESDYPSDLIDDLHPTPFWLAFDSPRRVTLDVLPAATGTGRARQRIERARRRGGIAVRAALIQANDALFAPGTTDLPCLVLFGFDDRVTDAELEETAGRVVALKGTTQKDRDLAFVAGLTTDERFLYYGRERLPRVLAGRRDLFVAHLYVHRPFLSDGYLDGRVLECVAEPGDRGMLELLPN